MHVFGLLRSVLLAGFALLLLNPPPSHAQSPSSFSFGGELRARSELDGRALTENASVGDIHLLRTRLHANVDPADRVDVFVEIQDSRRFGAGAPSLARGTMDPSAGRLDVHQAYFTVDPLIGTRLSVQVGRQELIYGNQRLIGSVGWSNVGRTFDAGVLAYHSPTLSVDMFAARLGDPIAEEPGSQNLFGLYSSWQVGGNQTVDVFALLDNDTNDWTETGPINHNRLYRLTPGILIRGSQSSLSYRLEAMYQTGKKAVSANEPRASIRASLLSAEVQYTVQTGSDLTFDAGYTRLSGDDTPNDNVLGQFNTLFATNHKFYGFMDYFPGAATPYGLQDVQLGASVHVLNAIDLAVDYHHFRTAERRPGASNHSLGNELDLTVTYRLAKPVTFSVGVSGFQPGEAMPSTETTDSPAYWGYLASTISF